MSFDGLPLHPDLEKPDQDEGARQYLQHSNQKGAKILADLLPGTETGQPGNQQEYEIAGE
jgi:hypothetical protein